MIRKRSIVGLMIKSFCSPETKRPEPEKRHLLSSGETLSTINWVIAGEPFTVEEFYDEDVLRWQQAIGSHLAEIAKHASNNVASWRSDFDGGGRWIAIGDYTFYISNKVLDALAHKRELESELSYSVDPTTGIRWNNLEVSLYLKVWHYINDLHTILLDASRREQQQNRFHEELGKLQNAK